MFRSLISSTQPLVRPTSRRFSYHDQLTPMKLRSKHLYCSSIAWSSFNFINLLQNHNNHSINLISQLQRITELHCVELFKEYEITRTIPAAKFYWKLLNRMQPASEHISYTLKKKTTSKNSNLARFSSKNFIFQSNAHGHNEKNGTHRCRKEDVFQRLSQFINFHHRW